MFMLKISLLAAFMLSIQADIINQLTQMGFAGEIVANSSSQYLKSIQLYNSEYDDRRPLVISYASSSKDVSISIQAAQSCNISIIIRSGGHSFGNASEILCDFEKYESRKYRKVEIN